LKSTHTKIGRIRIRMAFALRLALLTAWAVPGVAADEAALRAWLEAQSQLRTWSADLV
jgi:hypothetical protein